MHNQAIYSTNPETPGSPQNLYEWNNINSPQSIVSRNGLIKKTMDESKFRRIAHDRLQEHKILKFGDRSNENSLKFNIRTVETPKNQISLSSTKILDESKQGMWSKGQITGNQDSINDSIRLANLNHEPISAALEELRKRNFNKNLIIDTEPHSAPLANSKLKSSTSKNIKISRDKITATPVNPFQDSQSQERTIKISNRNNSPIDSFAKDKRNVLFQIKKKHSLRDDSDWANSESTNLKNISVLSSYLSQVQEKNDSSPRKKESFTPTNATSKVSGISHSTSQARKLKFNNFTQGVTQQAAHNLMQMVQSKNQKDRNTAFLDNDSDDETIAPDGNPRPAIQSAADLKKESKQNQKTNAKLVDKNFRLRKQASGLDHNGSDESKTLDSSNITRSLNYHSKGIIDAKKVSTNQEQDNSRSVLNGFITRVQQGDSTLGLVQKQSSQQDQSADLTKNTNSRPINQANSIQNRAGPSSTNQQRRFLKAAPGMITSSQNFKPTSKTPIVRQTSLLNRSSVYYISNMYKYHKNPDQNDYLAPLYREHFIQTYQALNFCKNLKPVDPHLLEMKTVHLERKPSAKGKKTLVFDLDETLIHCNESICVPFDVKLPIIFPNGEIVEAGVNIRPYALEVLKELSSLFEIIVFTASHSCYANIVLDFLDPKGQYIHHRIFRENCVQTPGGVHIKDLRIFGNRYLSDIILVDNAAYSFGMQIENGIPIIPYYNNKEDQELKKPGSFPQNASRSSRPERSHTPNIQISSVHSV